MITSTFSSQKSFFWALVTCVALAGAGFSWRYFGESYPIISLSIEMNREQALTAADKLSSEREWLPTDHRSAVEFKSDPLLQFFIELECGGKKTFSELLQTKEYEPYQWQVRHFQEKVTHETSIFFTPEGKAYGLDIKLPETEIHPGLTTPEARDRVQQLATEEWNIDFTPYREIEASKEQKTCGRIDHTFVYERTDVQLGAEGKYRLRLVISGDLLTKVERFVFIPETFVRRFEEMRSSNTSISTFGKLGFQLLYRFLGCLVAGFIFLRRRMLRLTPAVYWGTLFGILTVATILNHLPLLWMSYDTATSASSFLMRTVLEAVLQGCAACVILTGLISVCLSWDRLGFPLHLTFSKLWSPTVGASTSVAGRTVGAYLFVPAWIGIMTATYLLFTKIFHWWSPADTLVNPNILATYLPWLTPFTLSLQAGFNEELLFRALPLAASALAGRMLNREKTGIALGFLIQALIFGACHADYPQTPGYFRLAELFVPSLCFGLLYVFYGLLPGIIAHFVYDFCFMSLPIFATTASSHALLDKLLVIALLSAPLGIIFYYRLKRREWYIPTEQDRNNATLVSVSLPPESTHPLPEPLITTPLPSFNKRLLMASGFAGFLLWLWATPFKADTPSLQISKKQALVIAREDFSQKEVNTPSGFVWEQYPHLATAFSNMDAFVWREEGKQKYFELLNSYLTPPCWAVRFLSFSGPVIERAQEFISVIAYDGSIIRSNLILPESQPGMSLSEGQARGIALEAVHNELNLLPEVLKEISAVVQDRPHRKDWTFTFQDKNISFKAGGEARISVTILGDKVTNVYRHVFVPETWLRDQQQTDLYRHLGNFFIQFIGLFTFILAFFVLQKRFFSQLSSRAIILGIVCLVPVAILSFLNGSEQTLATILHSSQPYNIQLFSFLAFHLAKLLVYWSLIALCIAGSRQFIFTKMESVTALMFSALSIELVRRGLSQAIILFANDRFLPLSTGDLVCYNSYSPLWAAISFYELSFVQSALLDMICIGGFFYFTRNSTRPIIWGIVLFAVTSITSCGLSGATIFVHPLSLVIFGIARAAVITAGYYLLFRYDQRTIIFTVAARLGLMALEEGALQAYPNALLYAGCAAVVIFITAYYWVAILGKD